MYKHCKQKTSVLPLDILFSTRRNTRHNLSHCFFLCGGRFLLLLLLFSNSQPGYGRNAVHISPTHLPHLREFGQSCSYLHTAESAQSCVKVEVAVLGSP